MVKFSPSFGEVFSCGQRQPQDTTPTTIHVYTSQDDRAICSLKHHTLVKINIGTQNGSHGALQYKRNSWATRYLYPFSPPHPPKQHQFFAILQSSRFSLVENIKDQVEATVHKIVGFNALLDSSTPTPFPHKSTPFPTDPLSTAQCHHVSSTRHLQVWAQTSTKGPLQSVSQQERLGKSSQVRLVRGALQV